MSHFVGLFLPVGEKDLQEVIIVRCLLRPTHVYTIQWCWWRARNRDRARFLLAGRSGVRHVLDVDYPRGSPKNPATRAELEVKFDALATPIFTAGRLAQIKAALFALRDTRTSYPHRF